MAGKTKNMNNDLPGEESVGVGHSTKGNTTMEASRGHHLQSSSMSTMDQAERAMGERNGAHKL